MQAMQYKVSLPNDYDMDIIRHRVQENGKKTDAFQDLLLKAYLILDQEDHKEYSPLYLWKNESGMNTFLFEGFYDNILKSFGWQNINIGIPLKVELNSHIKEAKYILEIEKVIPRTTRMERPDFSFDKLNEIGRVLIYNPDKWRYVEFYFFDEYPTQFEERGLVYNILHISM